MEQVKILIIEDELIIAEDLSDMLEEMGYEVTGIASDWDEAQLLFDQTKPDIATIDIMLAGEKDGIAVAKSFNEKKKIPFVFLTSHTDKETVERAKKAKPSSFLVKPFTKDALYTAIEVAMHNFSDEREAQIQQQEVGNNDVIIHDCLFIKDGNLLVKVKAADVLYLKSAGVYIELHTKERKFLVRSKFESILAKLNNQQFFQIHRSYIINLSHIEAINQSIVLIDGQRLPVARSHRDELISRIHVS